MRVIIGDQGNRWRWWRWKIMIDEWFAKAVWMCNACRFCKKQTLLTTMDHGQFPFMQCICILYELHRSIWFTVCEVAGDKTTAMLLLPCCLEKRSGSPVQGETCWEWGSSFPRCAWAGWRKKALTSRCMSWTAECVVAELPKNTLGIYPRPDGFWRHLQFKVETLKWFILCSVGPYDTESIHESEYAYYSYVYMCVCFHMCMYSTWPKWLRLQDSRALFGSAALWRLHLKDHERPKDGVVSISHLAWTHPKHPHILSIP